MEVVIGSNTIRNTSGVLNVRGKKQIFLEIGRDGQLLLNMDLYDSARNHVAKLRRNAWAFNKEDKFEVTTSSASLKLIDKKTRDVVVEVNVEGKDKVEVLRGKFYTYTGELLEITPQFWSIGRTKLSGNTFDGCGGAVAIGEIPN